MSKEKIWSNSSWILLNGWAISLESFICSYLKDVISFFVRQIYRKKGFYTKTNKNPALSRRPTCGSIKKRFENR